MIKSGEWVKYSWNDFLSKSNKKVRTHIRVVKLCWNEFLSKVNNKNVIKSGGGVKLCWNDFFEETNGSCQIKLE